MAEPTQTTGNKPGPCGSGGARWGGLGLPGTGVSPEETLPSHGGGERAY